MKTYVLVCVQDTTYILYVCVCYACNYARGKYFYEISFISQSLIDDSYHSQHLANERHFVQFVHIPPFGQIPPDQQLAFVAALIEELVLCVERA